MAPRLKQLVHEIHRRSLWQVLTVYLGASWAVMEFTDQIVDRYLLPEWVYPAALILLLIGLPIVLATALVREEKREPEPVAEVRDPTLLGDVSDEAERLAGARSQKPAVKLLTWPRAILGGVLAFAGLALVSALIVMQGTARVTEAHGAAGDAFEERAWVILAQLESSEAESEVALAAEAALTVDLQQSQYVNVRGRNQIVAVLRRMELPDTTPLDEQLALEIAEREGLAAVLAPAVSRLGDNYVFTARVVQPGSGEELISVRAAAREDRLLEGVETLSRELRRRLGESADAIRRSKPLPEVTTRSLDALKKYAQADAIYNYQGDSNRLVELVLEAVRLDSTFAMAYRLASVAYYNLARVSDGAEAARRAYELRDRLTDRERFHVEGFYYIQVERDPRRAIDTYDLMLSQYPDDDRAANNIGVLAGTWLGDRPRSYESYRQALELNPYSGISYGNLISSARWTERWEVADSLVRVAEQRGFGRRAGRWSRSQAVGLADWDRADAICDSLLAEVSSPGLVAGDRFYCGALDIARGRIRRGSRRLKEAARFEAERSAHLFFSAATGNLALAERMRGRDAAAHSYLEGVLARIPADSVLEPDRFFLRTYLRSISALLGTPDIGARVVSTYPPSPDTEHWVTRYGEALAAGAEALGRGEPEIAVSSLREAEALGYRPGFWQVHVNLIYGLAFEQLGAVDSAVSYLEAAIVPARVASWGEARVQLPLVIRRLADLEESRGNTEAAAQHYRRLLQLWSDADPELQDQVTSARRALARLTAETS